jgi:[ribosomal protein S5]-alanine N-acetyltransferase
MKSVLNPDGDSTLRPTTAADLPELRALLHDVEVRRYLCDDEILPDSWITETLQRSDELNSRGLGLWVIQSADAVFSGMAGLRPLSETGTRLPDLIGEVQLTIAVMPAASGTGLARRASERLLRHGFDDLGLARVIAIVDDPNERSHVLIRRLGFRRIGTDVGPAYTQTVYELMP